jgi:phage shock protein PspC (stress-responsive transcriptional regulator)
MDETTTTTGISDPNGTNGTASFGPAPAIDTLNTDTLNAEAVNTGAPFSGAPVTGAPVTPVTPVAVAEPVKKPFRLHRSRSDKMLGGVCGGLAESLDVDAGLIRIGLVALTVFGFGAGVLFYAAAWVLAPVE